MLCRNHIDVSEGVRRCARCGSPFCQSCLVDIGGKPYCATCKSEEILDVRSGVQSGELDLASVGRRFGAEFVDGFVLMIPIIVILVATTVAPANRFSNLRFISGGLAAGVQQGANARSRRQTLGKMAMKVKVVNADGSALSAG